MERKDEGFGFLLQYENIAWYTNNSVRILDRRVYPYKKEYVTCTSVQEVAQAIKDMVTQSGGPYVAARMGMVLSCKQNTATNYTDYMDQAKKDAYALSHARITTVKKMEDLTNHSLKVIEECFNNHYSNDEIVTALFDDAIAQQNNTVQRFDQVASYLYKQIPFGGSILTQCFGETVVGCLLRLAKKNNNPIKVYCCETRPYLQGARLTASLANEMGFDVTIVCDNMPGYLFANNMIDVFTSAADVITKDGSVVNKVGTYQIATLAKIHNVPYFVTGFPNSKHPDLDSVTIEMRDENQVTHFNNTQIVEDGVKGFYPAFDKTPNTLVTGIVTDRGIFTKDTIDSYFK